MAALTNTPAFDLEAVAACALFSTRETEMDKIAAALGTRPGTAERMQSFPQSTNS
jgi:hypothetical protein